MAGREPCDLLIRNAARLMTVAGGAPGALSSPSWEDLGLVEGGAVAARGGEIVAVGATADVERAVEPAPDATVIDAAGKLLMPGFVDPHTHFLFAGSREEEYGMRAEGIDYMEIRRLGGGHPLHRALVPCRVRR